jgi:hypothetical protein
MRLAAVLTLALAALSSTASAAPVIGGIGLTLDPSKSPESGQMSTWFAYAPGSWFLGGELALGSAQVDGAELAISYHAILGIRAQLSRSWFVLADGGLGVSQQIDWKWNILGDDDMEITTREWVPSTAARVQLGAELGQISRSHVGIALASDARTTLGDSAALELGLGLGFFVWN